MIYPDCNHCGGTGEQRFLAGEGPAGATADIAKVLNFRAWRGGNPDGQPPLKYYVETGCRKCALRTWEDSRPKPVALTVQKANKICRAFGVIVRRTGPCLYEARLLHHGAFDRYPRLMDGTEAPDWLKHLSGEDTVTVARIILNNQ